LSNGLIPAGNFYPVKKTEGTSVLSLENGGVLRIW
jgi:hypothetical protein